MAPVQYALQNDEPGMGGFVYKDLLKSSVGKYIDASWIIWMQK